MEGFLHLLSEDENDDLFYKGCVEKLTGLELESLQYWRSRIGGTGGLNKLLSTFLQQIGWIGSAENNFFLIAIDNDRCPAHPPGDLEAFEDKGRSIHDCSFLAPGLLSRLPKRELNKQQCRYCQFKRQVDQVLGTPWPIGGAIAVPVQMLESWLLLISNPEKFPDESQLPIFSSQEGALARRYHDSQAPQLKDLAQMEKERLGGLEQGEYCLHCAEELDPEDLAERSPSFAHFVAQVELWEVL